MLGRADVLRLLGFSFLRYLLFLSPYVILCVHLEIAVDKSILTIAAAISSIFLLQTFSSGIILNEIALRISVPAFVFSQWLGNTNGLETIPGIMIYCINVLLPMIAGAIIFLSFKMKK